MLSGLSYTATHRTPSAAPVSPRVLQPRLRLSRTDAQAVVSKITTTSISELRKDFVPKGCRCMCRSLFSDPQCHNCYNTSTMSAHAPHDGHAQLQFAQRSILSSTFPTQGT
eukprot:2868082-Amphidinium_carterae.2